ncbi:MAG: TadE/TadG family type IV pilus assembly protein [Candidatus Limnocylindrales bacterium]
MARPATRGPERGQSLVEFALVFPVFILLLAGIFDFGFGLYSQMTVINAAREAARSATIDPDRTTILEIAQARVQAVAPFLNVGNLTVTATCVPIVSTTCDFSSATSSKRGDAVSITVAYPYQLIFPLAFGKTFNLTSTAQMILQ